jgi:predicted dehydrogenase
MGRVTPKGVTRRDFLKGAAVAAVAPAIIPATALGREGRPAPSERIVMGGMGVGNRGGYDLRRFLKCPEVQFVADSDPRRERREMVKKDVDDAYGNTDCKLYVDFREMLARDDIDAVLLATGDRWHSMGGIFTMRAGKDIYSEKPCSISITEARALADTERQMGRVYQAGTQRRSEENFVFVMELARTGKLGKLHTMTAHIMAQPETHRWLPPEPEPAPEDVNWDLFLGPAPWRPYNRGYLGWHWHYDLHGGGIPEWASHTVDMCQWANASEDTGPIEFEFPGNDTGQGLVARYANGVKLVLRGDEGAKKVFPGSCGVRFEGSEGWAECSDGQEATFAPASLGDLRNQVIKDYVDRTGRPFDHWQEFLDCVKSRRYTVSPARVAHRSISVSHVANICMELKRNVKWDPAKEEFVGDEQANRMRSRPMRAPWQV